MDRRTTPRRAPTTPGLALLAALGAGALAACELVLGTLPPVADGGPGAGGAGTSTGTTGGATSSTSVATTTGTTGTSTGSGGACPGSTTACPVDGGHVCVDTSTDPQFCGSCDTHCAGGTTCNGTTCVPACSPGLTMCGATCVNLQSDPAHCGGCDSSHACPPQLSADLACQGGVCALTCSGGLKSCSVAGGKTACADVTRDATHCGTCGNACATGEVCAGGVCQPYFPVSGCEECAAGKCCPLDGDTVCIMGDAGACP
jgi:hypothetical protein